MINFPDAPTIGQLHASGEIAWRWDGEKWVALGGDTPIQVVTPASGAVVYMTGPYRSLFVDTGPLASLMIWLPWPVVDGDEVELCFAAPVTALDLRVGGSGAVIDGSPASAYGPGAAIVMRYVDGIWIYWK